MEETSKEEQILAENRKKADMFVAKGKEHLAMNKVDEARKCFFIAIDLVPTHREAVELLTSLPVKEPVSKPPKQQPKMPISQSVIDKSGLRQPKGFELPRNQWVKGCPHVPGEKQAFVKCLNCGTPVCMDCYYDDKIKETKVAEAHGPGGSAAVFSIVHGSFCAACFMNQVVKKKYDTVPGVFTRAQARDPITAGNIMINVMLTVLTAGAWALMRLIMMPIYRIGLKKDMKRAKKQLRSMARR